MQIASYFVGLNFKISQKEIRKVDTALKLIEEKLKKFNSKLTKSLDLRFRINQPKLNKSLGDALDKASMTTTFEISRFVVNDRNMRAALLGASRRAGSISAPVSSQAQPPARQGRSESSLSRANFLHAGGSAGAFMRYGAGSLPLIGGVYGAGMLNRANQNLMSSNIAAQSVLGEQANPMMDWLSKRADYLGVNYAETLPQFTKFMASSMPLLGAEASRDVFSSFMQFGRTRGATGVSMNRALNAVSQMGAKGQIMQEELKGQLAEASGFGELPQLFAEAYQIQTGGRQTGAEARATLMKAMEDGLVKSDILPLVSKLMNELSKGGIEKARTSSIAEQERALNALTGRGGLLQTFSETGGEQGFANFFKSMTELFKSATPLVKALAGSFEDLTKVMQAPVTLFGKMTDVLKFMSSETGIAEKNFTNLAMVGGLMMTKWGRVATMFTTMLIVLEDIAMGVSGEGDSFTGRFIEWMEEGGAQMGPFEKGLLGVSAAMLSIAVALKAISGAMSLPGIPDIFKPGKGPGVPTPTRDPRTWKDVSKPKGGGLGGLIPLGIAALTATGLAWGVNELAQPMISARDQVASRWNDPMSPLYGRPEVQLEAQRNLRDPSSEFFNNLAGFEERYNQMARMNTLETILNNQTKYGTSLPGVTPMSSNVEVKMDVKIAAANPEDFNEEFQKKFKDVITQTLLQYSQKE